MELGVGSYHLADGGNEPRQFQPLARDRRRVGGDAAERICLDRPPDLFDVSGVDEESHGPTLPREFGADVRQGPGAGCTQGGRDCGGHHAEAAPRTASRRSAGPPGSTTLTLTPAGNLRPRDRSCAQRSSDPPIGAGLTFRMAPLYVGRAACCRAKIRATWPLKAS